MTKCTTLTSVDTCCYASMLYYQFHLGRTKKHLCAKMDSHGDAAATTATTAEEYIYVYAFGGTADRMIDL